MFHSHSIPCSSTPFSCSAHLYRPSSGKPAPEGFALLRVPTLSQGQDLQPVKHRQALEAAEFCTDFFMFPGSSCTSRAPRADTSQLLPLRAWSQQTHHLYEDLFVLQPRLEMHSFGHGERPLHIHPRVTRGPMSSPGSLSATIIEHTDNWGSSCTHFPSPALKPPREGS